MANKIPTFPHPHVSLTTNKNHQITTFLPSIVPLCFTYCAREGKNSLFLPLNLKDHPAWRWSLKKQRRGEEMKYPALPAVDSIGNLG